MKILYFITLHFKYAAILCIKKKINFEFNFSKIFFLFSLLCFILLYFTILCFTKNAKKSCFTRLYLYKISVHRNICYITYAIDYYNCTIISDVLHLSIPFSMSAFYRDYRFISTSFRLRSSTILNIDLLMLENFFVIEILCFYSISSPIRVGMVALQCCC